MKIVKHIIHNKNKLTFIEFKIFLVISPNKNKI